MAAVRRHRQVCEAPARVRDVTELMCRAVDAAASLRAASDSASDVEFDLVTRHEVPGQKTTHNKRYLQKEQ